MVTISHDTLSRPSPKQGPAPFKINNNNNKKKGLCKRQRLMREIITVFFFIKVIYKMTPASEALPLFSYIHHNVNEIRVFCFIWHLQAASSGSVKESGPECLPAVLLHVILRTFTFKGGDEESFLAVDGRCE